jgi:hypothetical protein
MRKLVLFVALVVAGAVVVRKLRSSATPSAPPSPAPPPPPRPRERPSPVERAPAPAASEADPAPAGPPPSTTNGERVVLMSISSLEERGEEPTVEAVVGHVAAGEIHPDEGTVEALLHRLAGSGLLTDADGDGSYRLTASGRAALLDGSPARPSPAGGAADELSSPVTGTS